jgi:predicted CoA-binding protein
MNHDEYDVAYIRDILANGKTIAVVGASANPERPSYYVPQYLQKVGRRIIPINPGHAGAEILGEKVYATLADVPVPIDIVDVFRRSEAVPEIVEQAIALSPKPTAIWMQIGVRNDEAAAKAEAAGIKVVMDRCPKVEIPRLNIA